MAMFRQVADISSPGERGSGPAIDLDALSKNTVLQEDCLEHLDSIPLRKYSCHVFKLLDHLGYSYEMTKCRQQIRGYIDMDSGFMSDCTRVTTGGVGEGTAMLAESDTDFMYIFKDVVCTDNPNEHSLQENLTLFQIERHETSPGYARLKFVKGTSIKRVIYDSMFISETGSRFLSSQAFVVECRRTIQETYLEQYETCFTVEDVSGPSSPDTNGYFHTDNVCCFRCFCPDILNRWLSRPRYHGWPCSRILHEISRLDGHVVPVGSKGSENMYREWRICYSLGELHLMRCCNETQVKLYILLKKLCKSALRPICTDMTSYTMKNIVFWVCERNGAERFKPDVLMERLFDCIKYLRECINSNVLPSYMIPERNLLAGRLDIQRRQELTSVLSGLLHEGGRMLMRIDKLRDGMILLHMAPRRLREFGEKRDKVEYLFLILTKFFGDRRQVMSKDQLDRIEIIIRDTVDHIVYLTKFHEGLLIRMGISPKDIEHLRTTRVLEFLS